LQASNPDIIFIRERFNDSSFAFFTLDELAGNSLGRYFRAE